MTPAVYRGVVQGGVVVAAEEKLPWKDGTEVYVTPVGPSGNPADILAALAAGPQVPADWVDELEDLIQTGERPATNEAPFSQHRLTQVPTLPVEDWSA